MAKNASGLERAAEAVAAGTSATRMARLAHRYLKDTILSGAHKGESSELHGVNAVPAYASGSEFGQGEDGKY
jgi:hypothetical protein